MPSACIVHAIIGARIPSLFNTMVVYHGSRLELVASMFIECIAVYKAVVQLRRAYGVERNYYGVLDCYGGIDGVRRPYIHRTKTVAATPSDRTTLLRWEHFIDTYCISTCIVRILYTCTSS